jgi:hypothetical protein
MTASVILLSAVPDLVPPRRSLALREDEFSTWLETAGPGARKRLARSAHGSKEEADCTSPSAP